MFRRNDQVIPGLSGVSIVLLAGISLSAIAFLLRDSQVTFTVLLSVSAALIASIVVVVAGRLMPPASERVMVLRGHVDVFQEFERMLNSLDKSRPHTVRTISSFLARQSIEEEWDKAVTDFLKESPQSQFVRILFPEEWKQRLQRIAERYKGLPNYIQHSVKESSAPAIEMFLVDRDEVLLSFPTEEKTAAVITCGVKLNDYELCERLEAYHRVQLEQRIPRDDLTERTEAVEDVTVSGSVILPSS